MHYLMMDSYETKQTLYRVMINFKLAGHRSNEDHLRHSNFGSKLWRGTVEHKKRGVLGGLEEEEGAGKEGFAKTREWRSWVPKRSEAGRAWLESHELKIVQMGISRERGNLKGSICSAKEPTRCCKKLIPCRN
jgi:hypothetical protein